MRHSKREMTPTICFVYRLPRPNLPEYEAQRSISRKPDESQNAERHQQRVRSFAHEAGNWATFVGIQIPLSEEWCDMLEDLEEKFSSLGLKRVEDFHVSLSRVVVLKYHWINGFVESVRHIISNSAPFPLTLQGLSVYLNDDKTRTFLAVDVALGWKNVDHIVEQLDDCLNEYGLPKFYSSHSYHSSVLWGLGDLSAEIKTILESDTNNFALPIAVNEMFCKTGNKFYKFFLS